MGRIIPAFFNKPFYTLFQEQMFLQYLFCQRRLSFLLLSCFRHCFSSGQDMSLLSFIQYSYLRRYKKLVNENRYHADKCQQRVFQQLISSAKNTSFGKEHQF